MGNEHTTKDAKKDTHKQADSIPQTGDEQLQEQAPETSLTPAYVLHLQRTIGNKAVQRLVGQNAVDAHLPITKRIQRSLNEDQKKTWENEKADEIIAGLRLSLEAWKIWRKSPTNFATMPKGDGKSPRRLGDVVQRNGIAFGKHAAEQLGNENVQYFTEMASMMPEYDALVGAIPGVKRVEPNHVYRLTALETDGVFGTIQDKVLPIGKLKVSYNNSFGWSWTKDLMGGALSLEVGFGLEWKKKVRSPKGGLSAALGTVSVNGRAIAKTPGYSYWGLDNLAGVISLANGPSVKGSVLGFGVKSASGGVIALYGNNAPLTGPLNFDNFDVDFGVDGYKPEHNPLPKPGEGPSSLKEKIVKVPEVSLSIAEVGVGYVAGIEGDKIFVPENKPKVEPAEEIWKAAIVGFDIGKFDVPSGETNIGFQRIKTLINDKQQAVEAQKPILEEAGVSSDFKVDFLIEGFASRPWTGAKDDTARQDNNKELSFQRAEQVAAIMHKMFAKGENSFTTIGLGAAVQLVTYTPDFQMQEEIIPEQGNEQIIEEKIKQKEKQIAVQFPDMTPAEVSKAARAQLGKTPASENPGTRRVNITATWKGFKVT